MLKKRFFKKGTVRVTFELPKDFTTHSGEPIRSAAVVGEFNDWDRDAHPMKRVTGGVWKAHLTLEPDREYQFRYLVNGTEWHNEWQADGYVPNNIDGDNSVVSTRR